VLLRGCQIVGNSGAVEYNPDNYAYITVEVDDCLLIGNSGPLVSPVDRGFSGPILFEGCVMTDNSSYGGPLFYSGDVQVRNSILWDNVEDWPSYMMVTYSCIENGSSGAGNIAADPLFVSLPSEGLDGIWGTNDDSWDLRLQPGSPCIDAGSNPAALVSTTSSDYDGQLRFHDDTATLDTGLTGGLGGMAVVDMGAFEFDSVQTPWTDLQLGGGPTNWITNLYANPITFMGNASFAASGSLGSGEETTLRVETPIADPGRQCLIIVGTAKVDMPVFGGTLVPSPDVIVSRLTDSSGVVELKFGWPVGLPSGFPLYYQAWVDTTGTATFTSSNALLSEVP